MKYDEEAIETILEAVKKAGYEPGKDFKIAMDAASSEWKTGTVGEYKLPKAGTVYTSEQLIDHWKKLVEKYPIISIEDALDEEDIPSQMPEAASTSVGGWVTELLGHIPEVGETVQVGTFQFQVLETDNQSVTKIALQVSPEQKEEPKA